MKKYFLAVAILSLSAAQVVAAETPNSPTDLRFNPPMPVWEDVEVELSAPELQKSELSLDQAGVLGGGMAMEGSTESVYDYKETSYYDPYYDYGPYPVNLYLEEEVEVQLTPEQVELYGSYYAYDLESKEAAEEDLEMVQDNLTKDLASLGGGELKVDYKEVYESYNYDYYYDDPSVYDNDRDSTWQASLGFSVENADLSNLSEYKDTFEERGAYLYETIYLTNRQKLDAKKATVTALTSQVVEEKAVHNEYLKELGGYSLGDLSSFYLSVYPDYQTLDGEKMTVTALVSLSVSYEVVKN